MNHGTESVVPATPSASAPVGPSASELGPGCEHQIRPWKPVLDGAMAEQAHTTAIAIADRLAAEARRPDHGLWDPTPFPFQYSSLSAGLAGGALLNAYLERIKPGLGYLDLAFEMINDSIERLAETPHTFGLYQGFAGIAWTVEHLADPSAEIEAIESQTESDEEISDGSDEINQSIDHALIELLDRSPWHGDYDLIRGLVGVGVYALERLPQPAAKRCLALLLDRLTEQTEPRGYGLAWRTAAEHLVPETRKEFPDGRYDLGVAHGNAGVIAFLARLVIEDVERERALGLLRPAVDWFIAQRLPGAAGGRFPAAIGAEPALDETPETARTAWCYGDPGAAIALLYAARALDDTYVATLAAELAITSARRDAAEGMIRDSGLCHGSVGLAHLLNRIFQVTGEPKLLAASRRWYQTTLDRRLPDRGIAGFLTWTPIDAENHDWREQPGLLVGATGIALALLAASSAVEPAWDRVFLLSLDQSRIGVGP